LLVAFRQPSPEDRTVTEIPPNPAPAEGAAVGIVHAKSSGEVPMRAAIFFATREGQTAKIAEHIASDLRAHAMDVDVLNVRNSSAPIDWSGYNIAFVAASVHVEHHEREMIEFVRAHRGQLDQVGAVFISVTMSEAGAEDPTAPPERRRQGAADAQRMIDVFVKETGWKPERCLPVAGGLMYTRYNLLIRFVMKRISRKQGGPTDTSRDYEFTDWQGLDRFVEEVVAANA
jgi:menaquinone-dependent protoporphyrinogen oxidase